MDNKPTNELEKILESTSPDEVDTYLKEHASSLAADERPLADYLMSIIRQKGISQQTVFERAGFSNKYGYRLLSQDKNTRQRDYILRLCFAAELSLSETQRALKLYGMSPLYAKVSRDAVLMIALNQGIHEISDVNNLLISHGMEPLKASLQP